MYKIISFLCTLIITFFTQSSLAQDDDLQTIYFDAYSDSYKITAEADIYSKIGSYNRGSKKGCLEVTLKDFRISSIVVDGVLYNESDNFPDIEMPDNRYDGVYKGFSIPFSNNGAIPKIRFEVGNVPNDIVSTMTVSENGKNGGCIYFDVPGSADEGHNNWKYAVVGNHHIISLVGGEAKTLASKIRNYLKVKGNASSLDQEQAGNKEDEVSTGQSPKELYEKATHLETLANLAVIPSEKLTKLNSAIGYAKSAKSKSNSKDKVYWKSTQLIEKLETRIISAKIQAREAQQEKEQYERELDQKSKERIEKFKREQTQSAEVREFNKNWNELTTIVTHYMKQNEENKRRREEYARRVKAEDEERERLTKKGFAEDRVAYQAAYENAIYQFTSNLENNADVMLISEAIEKAYLENKEEIKYTAISIIGPTAKNYAGGSWGEYSLDYHHMYGEFFVRYYTKPGTIKISEKVYENRFNIESFLNKTSCFNCSGEPRFEQNILMAAFTKQNLYRFISNTVPAQNKFQELIIWESTYGWSTINDSDITNIKNNLKRREAKLNSLKSIKDIVMNSEGVFELGEKESYTLVYFNKGKYIKICLKENFYNLKNMSAYEKLNEFSPHINKALNSIYGKDYQIEIRGVKEPLKKIKRFDGYAQSAFEANIVGTYINSNTLAINKSKDEMSFYSFYHPKGKVYLSDIEELLIVHTDYYELKFEAGNFVYRDNTLFEQSTGQVTIGPGFLIISEKDKFRKGKPYGTSYIVYDILNRTNGWYAHPRETKEYQGETKTNYTVDNKIELTNENTKDVKINNEAKAIQIPLGPDHQNAILHIGNSTNDFNTFYNLIKSSRLKSLGGEKLNFGG